MSVGTTRRQLLAGVSTAGIAATAGCLGSDQDVSPPGIGHDRFEEEWRRIDQSSGLAFEERIGPVALRAFEHTLVYEHAEMQAALAETFESIEGSPVTAFFSRLDLRPGIDRLPFGIARERVMAEIRLGVDAAFREELGSWGITEVRRDGRSTLPVETGHTATVFQYNAQFPIEDDVYTEEGTTETVTGTLALLPRLAVWHDGRNVLLAGGVSPAEPVAEAIAAAVPSDVTLSEDPEENEVLSADPETFIEAIETLIFTTE